MDIISLSFVRSEVSYGSITMFLVQLLSEHTHPVQDTQKWPVIGQFSSIGSMGLDKTKWLSSEFQRTLMTLGKSEKTLTVPETQLLLVSVSVRPR